MGIAPSYSLIMVTISACFCFMFRLVYGSVFALYIECKLINAFTGTPCMEKVIENLLDTSLVELLAKIASLADLFMMYSIAVICILFSYFHCDT